MNLLDIILNLLNPQPKIDPQKYAEAMSVAQGMTEKPARWDQVYSGIPFPGPQSAPTPTSTSTPTPTPTPTSSSNQMGIGDTISKDFQWQNGDTKPTIPDWLVPIINLAASKYPVSPQLLASQNGQELGGYGYDLNHIGSSGEIGQGQIIPKYHTPKGMSPEEYAKKLRDPTYNEMEQARILSEYIAGQGDVYNGLRQYNAGSNLDNAGSYASDILNRVGMQQYIPSTLLNSIK